MTIARKMAQVAAVMLLATAVQAQEAEKVKSKTTPVPLNVLVVLSEYDGEKKLSSLPYQISVVSDAPAPRVSSVRMGIKVPIVTQGTQVQYMDVGTDLDCTASSIEDGRFHLNLSVRRSSVYSVGPERKSIDWAPGDAPISAQPLVREFRTQYNLLLRDGQTAQSTTATDPVSGRVLKVEVTLNRLK